MTPSRSLPGTHRGPVSAIAPQPRKLHENEVRVGAPSPPWRSRRLPATLLAGDPRRTLFRTLLRRSEGVPVRFADGGAGVVEDVVLPMLGYDFWPEALVVSTGNGRRRVSSQSVRRIDVRDPTIWLAVDPPQPLEYGARFRNQRRRNEQRLHRSERRHGPVRERVLQGRRRHRPGPPVRGRK
ncbi:MAG TPA: hypothetical protein VFU51_14670 [Gaiellaceae bacterium]|nr:hypothetical protein [Gaiellaceae bacterium]